MDIAEYRDDSDIDTQIDIQTDRQMDRQEDGQKDMGRKIWTDRLKDR